MSILTGNNPFADYKAGRDVMLGEASKGLITIYQNLHKKVHGSPGMVIPGMPDSTLKKKIADLKKQAKKLGLSEEAIEEASVKIDIDDKEDQKTKQKESDNGSKEKPASGDEIEKGTENAAGDVKDAAASDDPDAMAAAGEEGMPDPENPGDLNGDGVVDMKDKKMAELEKDLRIRELERAIADIDDPEVEAGLKKAAPERPRIKNRGDHYAIINDKGEELEKIPFDNKKTSSREARYQALRRVDAIAAELNADHTAGIKDDPEGKMGEIDKQHAKDMEKADTKAGAEEGGKEGGMEKGGSKGDKESGEEKKKPAPVKESLEENAKVMKMLKGMDKDEARVIIQGLPKNLRAKAMKAVGLKEEDIVPESTKIDGRTKAYKEAAARIMSRKNKMEAAKKGQKVKIDGDEYEVTDIEESISLAEIDEEFDTLTEKRMFIAAARAAKANGDKSFLFNGKEYPCTVKEESIDEIAAGMAMLKRKKKDDEEEDLEEARRGRMNKGDEAEAEHPIMQLRKAVSLRSIDYQFASTGKKMKITDRDARKILQMYDKADNKMKMAMQKSMTGNEQAIKDLLQGKMPKATGKPTDLPKLRSLGEAGYEGNTQEQGSNSKGVNTGETPRSGHHKGKMPMKEYTAADFYADYIKSTTRK